MGAWGDGVVDNDAACDGGSDLLERNDLCSVERALDNVHGVLGLAYLDADVASEGLVACEVVARILGERSDSDGFMKDIDRWNAAHRSLRAEPLAGRAISAIDRVMRQPSELLELRDEVPDGPKFHSTVAELRARLAKHGSSGPANLGGNSGSAVHGLSPTRVSARMLSSRCAQPAACCREPSVFVWKCGGSSLAKKIPCPAARG